MPEASSGEDVSDEPAAETEPSAGPERCLAARDGCWAVAGDILWDGTGDESRHGLCVVMHGEGIVSVCPTEEARRSGIAVEHHPGCCVMPGLIDAHVHMEFSERHPLHEQPPRTAKELHAEMGERALRMLQRGITSARDLGGSGSFAAVKLRDDILAGHLPGPRLVCAGQPITTVGGHCHQWGGAVAGRDELQSTVDRQASHGVDWIKVMATGGIRTPGSRPDLAQFSEIDLREVVSLADACGLPVAAHAHATVGIKSAVAAGCRTIEHCSWIGFGQSGFCSGVDEETIVTMAKKGTYVAPTAHANWARWPKHGTFYRRMSGALSRLRKAGVALVASSDAGAIPDLPHDALVGGVEVLAEMSGMTSAEALRAATSKCAEAVGLGGVCGRLCPGLSADLLLVRGDPLSSLRALRQTQLVVARGRRLDPLERLAIGSNI